jgi:hypothetical protein
LPQNRIVWEPDYLPLGSTEYDPKKKAEENEIADCNPEASVHASICDEKNLHIKRFFHIARKEC